jgi:hypothetical protein
VSVEVSGYRGFRVGVRACVFLNDQAARACAFLFSRVVGFVSTKKHKRSEKNTHADSTIARGGGPTLGYKATAHNYF